MKTSRLLLFLLSLSAAVSAQQTPPASEPAALPPSGSKPIVEKIDLQAGDTLVFLGDSITHQCLYTQYVENYLFTRFPQTRVRFHNAGVGGDRAKNALDRFDEDVAAFKPKYVTVLLGMNDGGYSNYQQAIFDTYQQDMTTLLNRIAEIGATAVPMTPTMHDARAARAGKRPQEPRDTYYNGVLALYGAWLREQAFTRGLGFVDMYSPLNNITTEERKTDANFTVIKDAIHPGPDGQAIMAVALIDDMLPKPPVNHVTLQEKDGKMAASAENATVADLEVGDRISFTVTSKSIPWVLPAEAKVGYRLSEAGARLSSEKLTVRNVKPGRYELWIDGTACGQYDDSTLAAGVELGINEQTPQYQQALNVATLNKKRNDEAVRPLRDQWAQLKGRRSGLASAEQTSDPQLASKKEEFEKWRAGMKSRVEELAAKAKAFEDEIYQMNQPKARKYELRLVR